MTPRLIELLEQLNQRSRSQARIDLDVQRDQVSWRSCLPSDDDPEPVVQEASDGQTKVVKRVPDAQYDGLKTIATHLPSYAMDALHSMDLLLLWEVFDRSIWVPRVFKVRVLNCGELSFIRLLFTLSLVLTRTSMDSSSSSRWLPMLHWKSLLHLRMYFEPLRRRNRRPPVGSSTHRLPPMLPVSSGVHKRSSNGTDTASRDR